MISVWLAHPNVVIATEVTLALLVLTFVVALCRAAGAADREIETWGQPSHVRLVEQTPLVDWSVREDCRHLWDAA